MLTPRIKTPFWTPPERKYKPNPPDEFWNRLMIPNRRISVEEHYKNFMDDNMVVVNFCQLIDIANVKRKPYRPIFDKYDPFRDCVYPIKKCVLEEILDKLEYHRDSRDNVLKFNKPFVHI